jgi:hypothetical protein
MLRARRDGTEHFCITCEKDNNKGDIIMYIVLAFINLEKTVCVDEKVI